MMWRLKDECSSMSAILDQVKYRAEWLKYQEAQRRREEQQLEKERGIKNFILSIVFYWTIRHFFFKKNSA